MLEAGTGGGDGVGSEAAVAIEGWARGGNVWGGGLGWWGEGARSFGGVLVGGEVRHGGGWLEVREW